MSPEGFVLMAEMIANTEINLEAILTQVRRDCLRRIEAWLETAGAIPLSNEVIDASIDFLLREDGA
jgi:hypothetical protein